MHERFVCTAWRLIGPQGEMIRCEVWERETGLEVRELQGVDAVRRTQLCRDDHLEAAHVADQWAIELEAKGFTERP